MPELAEINDLVLLFLLSIIVSLVCNKVKLTPTVGFLLTGFLCGPSVLNVITDQESISTIAELGVAMLLFTIGMELSGDALSRLKKPVFLGGSLQIGCTVGAVAVLMHLQGAAWTQGIIWGCLVALSSSAIVLQIHQQKGLTSTPMGRLSLAILVFQDIMVAPMLLCIPLLAGTLEVGGREMLLAVGRVVLILGAVLTLCYFGLNRLMEAVMRTRSRELLLLTTLGLCFGMACLTLELQLSSSLGAFLAGLMLARSQYSMSVIAGILPYRDVFMCLFFMSVGMMLNLDFLSSHFLLTIVNAALFILIKTLLTLPAVLIQRFPLRTAIVTGLSLAQVGEFSFVLAALALESGVFSQQAYQGFLAVSVLTMMVTPMLINWAPRIADVLTRWQRKTPAEQGGEAPAASCTLHDHLIIVGFGISGKHLARVAKDSGITYNILEMNPETVTRYRDKEPIMHGDATQPIILEHLGIAKARVMAIIISDPAAVRAITLEARRMNPNIFIVARTRFVTEVAPLRRLGANAVIAEEFETSIEVFNQVLTRYLIPRQDIDAFTARVRQDNYRMIRKAAATTTNLDEVVHQLPDMGVQAIRLDDGSPLCDKSLVESNMRRRYGVTLVAAHRDRETIASPGPEFVMRAGDLLYFFGKTDKLLGLPPVLSRPAAKEYSAGEAGAPDEASPNVRSEA
ncbi:MAG TPA: cation:proton antiporter [Candidatus Desulfovibrio intestinavium]|uniref:Cation:proton antiporter n=1 Tax=Candidatus Desulfovibrio intestinavium TaxID=2838534 RepID=A0A9D2HQB3_9BACT|nr:cation:proton antiporter [Candidatus Desulfovibrio intestinavium]